MVERTKSSAAIRTWLAEDPAFIGATTVFAYLALPGEPDLGPLLEAYPGKRWCVSRVTEEDRLRFHHLPRLEEAFPGPLGSGSPTPRVIPKSSPPRPISSSSRGRFDPAPGRGWDAAADITTASSNPPSPVRNVP